MCAEYWDFVQGWEIEGDWLCSLWIVARDCEEERSEKRNPFSPSLSLISPSLFPLSG